jgi:hypothetical protein
MKTPIGPSCLVGLASGLSLSFIRSGYSTTKDRARGGAVWDRPGHCEERASHDESEQRLQLFLSVSGPLEHGADKDFAAIISIGRLFDLPSRSIAKRVTSVTRCRLSLSAALTVW